MKKILLFTVYILCTINAYAVTCDPGYYDNNGSCEKCTTDPVTGRPAYTEDVSGSTSCKVCPEVTGNIAQYLLSYQYYPSSIHSRGIGGCYAELNYLDDIATFDWFICYYSSTSGTYDGLNMACQLRAPIACAAGYGSILQNQPEWEPQNNYATFTGGFNSIIGKVCGPCAAGTYSPEGSLTCTTCPAGTYSAAGASSCTPCPTGTTSPIGASFCNTCPNLNTIIGTVQATAYASTTNTGATADGNPATYGISGELAFALDYGDKGVIIGHGRCSSEAGTGLWNGANNATEITLKNNLINENGTGRYCYCRLDSYTPVNGSTIALTGAWMFDIDDDSSDKCAFDCADNCGAHLRDAIPTSLDFRSAIFNNVSCPEIGIASTSYVQGMYEAINNSKMAKLNPNSIEFTPDSTPYGFFTEVEGVGDKFRFKREEPTLPFGSYENPTGRMSIWLE